jgi:integrase
VFTTAAGTPLDARNVVRSFKALLLRAGLPDRRFHDLRHSAATLLLVQGVPARVVMDILGHSQIQVTLGTYSHVLPELHRDAGGADGRPPRGRCERGLTQVSQFAKLR